MTRADFGTAYEANYANTVRGLIARGLHRDDAMEIAQYAWAKGWERLSQLRDDNKIGAWVWMIAVHQANDLIEKRTRAREVCLEEQAIGSDGANLIDQLDVMRAIHSCAPRLRTIVKQLYLDGCTQRELACSSGRSIASIRGQAYRARRALREHLRA
jgi:RNA polymerase sigma factor (sigma-70 family)